MRFRRHPALTRFTIKEEDCWNRLIREYNLKTLPSSRLKSNTFGSDLQNPTSLGFASSSRVVISVVLNGMTQGKFISVHGPKSALGDKKELITRQLRPRITAFPWNC